MNSTLNIKPVPITGFRGLYDRGERLRVPQDHLARCWNCVFPGQNQLDLRETIYMSSGYPVTSPLQATNIMSYFIAQTVAGPALITLNSDGRVFDETHATLLASYGSVVNGMHGLNAFGRAYIGFTNNGKAVSGAPVSVYIPSGPGFVLDALGGARPLVSLGLAPTTAGHVDIGVHNVVIAYRYQTGWISKPGTPSSIYMDGTHSIDIAPLTAAPPGVIARYILVTKANQSEFFFLPEGKITTGGEIFPGAIGPGATSTTTINFYDSELLDSADYLYDILDDNITATAIRFYKGRMVLVGYHAAPDQLLVSRVNDPETFDPVTGTVNMPVDYGDNTSNTAAVIRDVLYVMKPNSTYAVQDNGNDPSTWSVTTIDAGIGCFNDGMSIFASSMSAQDVFDTAMVCHKSGLRIFNGSYSDPPLTWKIEDVWNTIAAREFWHLNIAHDIWAKRVYIAVPIDRSHDPLFSDGSYFASLDGKNRTILMMDYKDGLNAEAVRWSMWDSQSTPVITYMSMENFTLGYTSPPQLIYQLTMSSGESHIYKVVTPEIGGNFLDTDPGNNHNLKIDQIIYSPAISLGRGVCTFSRIDFEVRGNGISDFRIADKYNHTGVLLRGFDLGYYDANGIQTVERLINQNSEYLIVILRNGTASGGIGSRVMLYGLQIYGVRMWAMRPAYVEQS